MMKKIAQAQVDNYIGGSIATIGHRAIVSALYLIVIELRSLVTELNTLVMVARTK